MYDLDTIPLDLLLLADRLGIIILEARPRHGKYQGLDILNQWYRNPQ